MPELFIGVREVAKTRNHDPATERQIKMVNIEIGKQLVHVPHAKHRATRLKLLSAIFGRTISSSKELTRGEVNVFMNELYNPATQARFVAEMNEFINRAFPQAA